MKWIDLYNFLYERANDINNLGQFPWQEEVKVFDFESLEYHSADFIQMPDNKISLSIDSTSSNMEVKSGS
jgi:hypothetical protein